MDGRKVGGAELLADRRAVHGREPRPAARDRRGGQGGRRLDAARRRLQAADLARTASRASGGEGLRLLAEAKEETGLPIVTELMDPRDLDAVLEVADVIQVGARNMQNYSLLAEIGRSGRAGAAEARALPRQIEELLMAAEYVLKEGNDQVMLCERGIRTFETATRFTLDIMAIPVLKELSHLPVVVDPSHAAGKRDLVLPLSLAAAAAGADGIIVEVHHDPDAAICDGPQAVPADEFAEYVEQVQARGGDRRQGAFARSEGRALRIAVVGVGLIGGSIGLAARERPRRRRGGRASALRSARWSARSSWARSTSAAASAAGGARGRRRLLRLRAGRRRRRERGREALAAGGDCCRQRRRLDEALRARRARRLAASRTEDRSRFVGGHPLAGAEAAGVEHAARTCSRARPGT